MTTEEKRILEAQAKIFRALAHTSRVYMVRQLEGGERCVCEFAEALGIDKSTASKHLTILREAGIVSTRKEGTSVYCTLALPCIRNFFACSNTIIERQLTGLEALCACK